MFTMASKQVFVNFPTKDLYACRLLSMLLGWSCHLIIIDMIMMNSINHETAMFLKKN